MCNTMALGGGVMKSLVLYSGLLKDDHYCLIKTMHDFDDFKKVIKVFSEDPYNEVLSDQDCIDEFDSYEKNGFVIGGYVDGQIQGINCILNDVPEDYSINFVNPKRIAYYSGLAVLKNCQKNGLGWRLVTETDRYIQELGKYDYSFARIRCFDSQSEGIFRKHGFIDAYQDEELIVDDVTYLRNTGVYDHDLRKYMVKKLISSTDNSYYKR